MSALSAFLLGVGITLYVVGVWVGISAKRETERKEAMLDAEIARNWDNPR